MRMHPDTTCGGEGARAELQTNSVILGGQQQRHGSGFALRPQPQLLHGRRLLDLFAGDLEGRRQARAVRQLNQPPRDKACINLYCFEIDIN